MSRWARQRPASRATRADITLRPRKVRHRSGVILIVVLVLLALLALPGITFTHYQDSRERTNTALAAEDLRLIDRAVHAYLGAHGRLPDGLGPLARDIGDDLAAGRAHGYLFELLPTRGGHKTIAQPAAVGITGSQALVINSESEKLEVYDLPAAGDSRDRMLAELKALFAREAAGALALDDTGEADRLAPAFVRDPRNVAAAFVAWDADADGQLTGPELFDERRWDDPSLRRMVSESRRIMRIGLAGEDIGGHPGVRLEALTGDPGAIWDYGGLKDLVAEFTTHRGTAHSLSALLDNAVRAARRGDDDLHDRFLEQFQEKARRQAGNHLSEEDAEVLIRIANGLL